MTPAWMKKAQRLEQLPPYAFARLDELKANARAQGLDLIDLGMGNPGGPTPAPVVAAAQEALANPGHHGYPPFEGTASFRQSITSWYQRCYGVDLNPSSASALTPKGKPCPCWALRRGSPTWPWPTLTPAIRCWYPPRPTRPTFAARPLPWPTFTR